MNMKFDKIYVVSLITNKDRQEFVKYQFNELGLDFEFIYGCDYYNFKNVEWPNVYPYGGGNIRAKDFGCALCHYQAVLQAYHFGYNNVLIFEDDICMNKDKDLIYDMLNNTPDDADFIDYDPRPLVTDDEPYVVKNIIDSKDNYIKLKKELPFIGAAMYGIMNRKIMELYLNSQHECFRMSDNVNNIFGFDKIIEQYYIPTKCLFIDQFTYNKIFINNDYTPIRCYDNMYIRTNKYNEFNFYKPNKFHAQSREEKNF